MPYNKFVTYLSNFIGSHTPHRIFLDKYDKRFFMALTHSTINFRSATNCCNANLFSKRARSDYRKIIDKSSSKLKAIFEPRSVAVIGATDRLPSVGRTLIQNLISGVSSSGSSLKIYPVNPTREEVLGLPCYSSIANVPHEVDMAVIVSPANTCIDVMRQCAEKKIKAAVVISAGFKEAGPDGAALERHLIDIAAKHGIRVIGPNCVGVMNPNYGLNATFAATMGMPGNVAFISQSGAMCTAILDWSLREKVGFSAFISVGSMADVHWGDLLEYLSSDENTKSIMIYMEAIGNTNAFIKAAEKVTMKKPVFVIKAGKSDAAAQAAASHTGSLAGSYGAFKAAMDRCGVLTVDSIQELADISLFLSKQPSPKGPKLTIITNAGGPAVLATDAAVLAGAEIAKISPESLDKLNSFLPAAWSHNNPVDILGDASAELYAKTLEVLIDDSESDGILVVLSPQDVTDPKKTAEALVRAANRVERCAAKPVFAAWMGGETVEEGLQILADAGIPAFKQPDTAAALFGKLWLHNRSIQELFETDVIETEGAMPDASAKTHAQNLIRKIQKDNRTLLTEHESKELLSIYKIPCTESVLALSKYEAMKATEKLQSSLYAVKLNSKTLTHKSDVSGVILNLNASEVASAFESIQKSVTASQGLEHFDGVTVQPMMKFDGGLELILGSIDDTQFGPVILFGSGGLMVEIYNDTALAIPPLNHTMVEKLIRQTKIYKALEHSESKRFAEFSIPELKIILMRFSQLVIDLADYVQEIDINPMLAMPKSGYVALDARIVLKKAKH